MLLRNGTKVANPQREQQSRGPEMRFPDTALRQIFSYLEFSDIKSCRLVSKQWHRFALDSFYFVLSLQRFNQSEPNPSPSQRIAAFETAAADNESNWIVQAKLVPCPAWLDWKAAEKKALGKVDASEPPEAISFGQMVAVIKHSFERNVKHVIVNDMGATISSILPALAQMAPAAATICAVNQRGTTRFVRQRQSGDFRCLELEMDFRCWEPYMGDACRLISNNAGFIVRISASSWWHVQTAVDYIEKHSDSCNGPVFNCCEQLVVRTPPSSTKEMLETITGHFPALRKLDYEMNGSGETLDVEPLEQLSNLTSLVVRNKWSSKLLQKLHFPNLVELRLGNDILLPEDQLNLFLPALTTLQLHADLKNALRLSTFGVPILSNLTVLTTTKLPMGRVKPFLRSILPVALKLQSLTIDLQLYLFSKVYDPLGRRVLTDIFDTLMVVPTCKAALTVGTFRIFFAGAVDYGDLVRQRVADIRERNLTTPITAEFKDYNNALVNTLSRAGAAGQGVVISAMTDDSAANSKSKSYELAWHNNVAGIQQKLKIRVSA